ncbi:MAG: DUF4131 domain-containing protein, partial [Bacteroidota bacterium]
MANFLQQRPALKAAMVISGGIILAHQFDLSVQLTSIVLAAFLLATLLFFLLKRKSKRAEHFLSFFLFCAVLISGAWKFALDRATVTSSALLTYADAGREVHLLGVVIDPPQKKPKTFQFVLRAEEIDAGREVEKARGDLLLYVPRDTAADSAMGNLRVGATIQV